jgi:hypothetical protein
MVKPARQPDSPRAGRFRSGATKAFGFDYLYFNNYCIIKSFDTPIAETCLRWATIRRIPHE